jgi:hypothetical protein
MASSSPPMPGSLETAHQHRRVVPDHQRDLHLAALVAQVPQDVRGVVGGVGHEADLLGALHLVAEDAGVEAAAAGCGSP